MFGEVTYTYSYLLKWMRSLLRENLINVLNISPVCIKNPKSGRIILVLQVDFLCNVDKLSSLLEKIEIVPLMVIVADNSIFFNNGLRFRKIEKFIRVLLHPDLDSSKEYSLGV